MFYFCQDSGCTKERHPLRGLEELNVSYKHFAMSTHWLMPIHDFNHVDPPGFDMHTDKEKFLFSDDDRARARIDEFHITFGSYIQDGDHLMVDLEALGSARHFHDYIENANFDHDLFFQKLKLRFDHIRTRFPNAIIGAYGYPIPNGLTLTHKALDDQIAGIQAAIDAGVLEGVDVLWALLYTLFGDDESPLSSRVSTITRVSLDCATALRRADGSEFQVGALMSQKVHNGNSAAHGERSDAWAQTVRSLVLSEYPQVIQGVWHTNSELGEGLDWWQPFMMAGNTSRGSAFIPY